LVYNSLSTIEILIEDKINF